MIHHIVFSKWVQAFSQRLRSELDEEALSVYYVELSAALDTDAFEVAARRVFRDHTYNTWPAPVEFIRAAPHHLPRPDPEALAEQQETRKLLASWDRTPTPRAEALDAFRAEWQAALADASPAALTRDRLRQRGPDIWLTDEREAVLRRELERQAAEARGWRTGPGPFHPPAPSIEQIARDDVAAD